MFSYFKINIYRGGFGGARGGQYLHDEIHGSSFGPP